MSVSRALVPSVRMLALAAVALLALIGCKSVSDPTTYDAPPYVAPPLHLFGVDGTSADNVYAVGQPGLIYHFDGNDWTREDSRTVAALTSVWIDAASNTTYATGHDGVILRKEGNGAWGQMASGTGEDLYDIGVFTRLIDGNPTRTVTAVGARGTILHLVGGAWRSADRSVVFRGAGLPDTLSLDEDVIALTAVFEYGLGGAYATTTGEDPGVKGCVLVDDEPAPGQGEVRFPWRLIQVQHEDDVEYEWITAAHSSTLLQENFVGNGLGRIFQLRLQDGKYSFDNVESEPFEERIYGVWAPSDAQAFAVTDAGRVLSVATSTLAVSELRNDGLTLFDIWGAATDDIFAVGICTDGCTSPRILRYHVEVPGEDPQWTIFQLPVPEDKAFTGPAVDKFGRPL